jgi:hypothetical protein
MIWSHGTRGGAGAIPLVVVGSSAAGHIAAHGHTQHTSYFLFKLGTYIRLPDLQGV